MAGDFGLACGQCQYLFPADQTMGVVGAHFETEHGTDRVDLELSVLCPRCEQKMTHLATIGEEHHFECVPCHRARVVHQRKVL